MGMGPAAPFHCAADPPPPSRAPPARRGLGPRALGFSRNPQRHPTDYRNRAIATACAVPRRLASTGEERTSYSSVGSRFFNGLAGWVAGIAASTLDVVPSMVLALSAR